jgi:AraC-like DNA-binding protein
MSHYELGQIYDSQVLPQYRVHRQYTGVSYLTWYLRKGELRLETKGQQFKASAGDWIFIDPLTMKSHYFSEDASLISIRFRMNLNGLHFLPPLQAPHVYRSAPNSDLLKTTEALYQFEAKHPHDTQKWALSIECQRRARFFEWLAQWHDLREQHTPSVTKTIDPRVYTILLTLEAHAPSREIDYDLLSKSVGLSRAQINRIFKCSTGLTPQQWRDAQCLRTAEDWIRAGQLSIKEIANELGFFDASYFTKWFRKKMGAPPSVWKEL